MTYLELGPIYALLVLILAYLLRQARQARANSRSNMNQKSANPSNPGDRELLRAIESKLDGIGDAVAQNNTLLLERFDRLSQRLEDIWREVHDGRGRP